MRCIHVQRRGEGRSAQVNPSAVDVPWAPLAAADIRRKLGDLADHKLTLIGMAKFRLVTHATCLSSTIESLERARIHRVSVRLTRA